VHEIIGRLWRAWDVLQALEPLWCAGMFNRDYPVGGLHRANWEPDRAGLTWHDLLALLMDRLSSMALDLEKRAKLDAGTSGVDVATVMERLLADAGTSWHVLKAMLMEKLLAGGQAPGSSRGCQGSDDPGFDQGRRRGGRLMGEDLGRSGPAPSRDGKGAAVTAAKPGPLGPRWASYRAGAPGSLGATSTATANQAVADQAKTITADSGVAKFSRPTTHQKIEALLGNDPVPGAHDPVVIDGRLHELAATAHKTGELFVELLVRLRDEQARGVHMGSDGCVTKAASALFDLHKAAQGYREVRLDNMPREEGVIAQAVHAQHGPGITGIVMKALKSWRDAVSRMPFPVFQPCEKQ
jgi:hypothetical protein